MPDILTDNKKMGENGIPHHSSHILFTQAKDLGLGVENYQEKNDKLHKNVIRLYDILIAEQFIKNAMGIGVSFDFIYSRHYKGRMF